MAAEPSVTAWADRVCPRCGAVVDLVDRGGDLFWVCPGRGCEWRIVLTAIEVEDLDRYAAEWDREAVRRRGSQRWWLN